MSYQEKMMHVLFSRASVTSYIVLCNIKSWLLHHRVNTPWNWDKARERAWDTIRGQYQKSSESIPAQHRTNACFSVFSPMLPNPNWSVAIVRSWLGSDDPVRSITVLVQYRRAENLYQPCIRSLRVTARCTLCYQYLTGPLLESVTAWYR